MKHLDSEEKHIASTYTREPITLVEGSGVKVKDEEGKEYLDFVAGIAVTGLGHSHPEISEILEKQSQKLVHVSNLYHIKEQAELAKKLAQITPEKIRKFFFCNSGTEAVEAALKLAIKHTGKDKILALRESFHGRTAGSLGVTWKKAYRAPFKSYPFSKCEFISPNDLEGVRESIDEETAALIAEPIQGEGGINVPSQEFLPEVREICREKGVLLIFDEIQTGMCRTGKWFASDHWNVEPDIMTMAKALGNGFPIGCMGAKSEVMGSFEPGNHASTFGGNPLACKVSKKVIEIMLRENIPEHVQRIGDYFKKELEKLSEKHGIVEEVRGLGLMLGVEVDSEENAKTVLEKARENGFLINRTADKVLRFVPPLIIKKKHINKLVKQLDKIFEEIK